VQNGQRVVISTNTINLQDQLINKDIPALQKILPVKFKAVALKGRSNYICPHRVQMFRAKENLSAKELRLLAKLLVWLPSTTTGDREELFMPDYAAHLQCRNLLLCPRPPRRRVGPCDCSQSRPAAGRYRRRQPGNPGVQILNY
jgi:hypothetical protein